MADGVIDREEAWVVITWAIPTINPRRIALLLHWLPDEPWSWVRDMVIFTPSEMIEEITRITEVFAPRWPIVVQPDPTWFSIPSYKYVVKENLAVKLAIPMMIDGPLLYTDDDIVVSKDPWPLLDGETRPFLSWGGTTHYYAKNEKDHIDLRRWTDWWGIEPFDMKFWNRHVISDAGTWFLPDRGDGAFRDKLLAFTEWRRGLDLRDSQHRKLDQHFLSLWNWEHNGTLIRYPIYTVYMSNIPQRMADGTFHHYCNGTLKERWENWFWDLSPKGGRYEELLAMSSQ